MEISRTITILRNVKEIISVRINNQAARPVAHFKAFYRFSQEFAALNFPVFNCFSFRRSWSPCYATIDSKILCQNILDRKWRIGTDKMPLFMRISLFKRRSSTGT
ncbi:hypothetical protein G6F57_006376 [Rhizopus arrhizus]|uniref:Uncharacterized protein n=1 Tax=Rhizopus oryzae TaxID=64495 RepID=A0A9P6XKV6_RHIOR|nr:hypothetical protein G6F23_005146 [Rhizopus arrhizus]KAG1425014.1 hypothetical protein G6F58_002110 [Rhizopus delemar]KAG0770518.1 hypothetical protein G6F24_000124 [Rhizopus arrhizus]KAG0792608.1 hypothetical protein G6F21_004230 [Rhizopus arrhizus]KAG0800591.1 hypothetical protein G6F22_002080 [Rhizopus arrhizus]